MMEDDGDDDSEPLLEPLLLAELLLVVDGRAPFESVAV